MKAKQNMYAKGGKSDPKKKKKKKKDVKGRDVSVGGNIDYNKPHEKTDFTATSPKRQIAERKLYEKLTKAGAVSGGAGKGVEFRKTAADREYHKKGYKKKLGYVGKDTRASMKVQSPADEPEMKKGGKVKAVKKYAKGGKHKKC